MSTHNNAFAPLSLNVEMSNFAFYFSDSSNDTILQPKMLIIIFLVYGAGVWTNNPMTIGFL